MPATKGEAPSVGASFTCFVVMNVPQTGDMTSTLRLLCVKWVSTLPPRGPKQKGAFSDPSPVPPGKDRRRPHLLCWRSRQDLNLQPRDLKSRALSS